ncbi:hypothetical protein NLG97_g6400 [Lecanicillium saksenae]|uniref:Uncharacterized protein n=1 Tax=Lecanicillium saksenae TaxID=468837 RepID=A0ACC1QQV8_9HYPO|nr:hypothetical protein NLG97_g6400 [Lecanicillium saksenae]
MSYYDVDAILTDAEKVPCQFELDVPYLGHLDNNPHGLKAGTPLLLPLWLAEMLVLASSGGEDSRAPLTLNLPPCLSDVVVAALKADPRAVALRDQTDVGLHSRKADEGMVAGLGEEFLRGLDEWERGLFRKGHEGVKNTKEWSDKVKKT